MAARQSSLCADETVRTRRFTSSSAMSAVANMPRLKCIPSCAFIRRRVSAHEADSGASALKSVHAIAMTIAPGAPEASASPTAMTSTSSPSSLPSSLPSSTKPYQAAPTPPAER